MELPSYMNLKTVNGNTLSLEIDGKKFIRHHFGFLKWRYYFGIYCLILADKLLNCELEVKEFRG